MTYLLWCVVYLIVPTDLRQIKMSGGERERQVRRTRHIDTYIASSGFSYVILTEKADLPEPGTQLPELVAVAARPAQSSCGMAT